MQFPILFENQTVGEVQVILKGLYYQFLCKCSLPDKDIYRIVLFDGTKEQNLGICVPDGQVFGLTKKLPKKNVNGEQWQFRLHSKELDDSHKVSVTEDTPFPMLDQIENASLQYENGEPFIAFRTEE